MVVMKTMILKTMIRLRGKLGFEDDVPASIAK
jgi:hypothetical protein